MKTLLRISAATLALAAAPAFAADVIESIPTPPVAIEVPFTWTGAYVGGQVGYLGASDDDADGIEIIGVDDDDDGEIDVIGGDIDGDGFIGGIHAGYNYQFGSGLVLGAYADIDFASVDVDIDGVADDVADVNYVARGMAKVGYGVGRALVYGQAGVAFVDIDLDGTDDDLDSTGYALGAGVDYALTDNVILGADYLYHNFSVFDDAGGLDTSDLDLDAHTVRAKFSYKF